MTISVHLDTDLGGDIDDLCALAMLLRWPDVDLVGVTTVAEESGRRAGYVRRVLQMAGRDTIPVAAGADVSLGVYRVPMGYPVESNYWPELVPPYPTPVEAALELLERSIEAGATIIGIGPFTNLRLLEERRPGILARVPLVLMGGFVYPPRPGYPAWGNDMDWNVQVDAFSAAKVFAAAHPTLVTIATTVETALRRAHLERLRQAGPVAQLIARQAAAFARDEKMAERFGQTCPGVPPDIINFLHDPLAAAIAAGWRQGVEMAELLFKCEVQAGWLVERLDPEGKPYQMVRRVDGAAFSQAWLDWVCG